MAEQVDGLITVSDTAKLLGRSTEQVRRYLREGAARPPAGRSVVHRPWGRRGVPVATSRRIDFERRLSFSDPDPLRDVIAIGGSGGARHRGRAIVLSAFARGDSLG